MSTDIETLKRVISANLSDIRTITDIARIIQVSTETLRKNFVRSTGMPLSAFLTACRVERAKDLLMTTDLRCREICTRVGFSREDVGAHVFKRSTGMTMEQFRNLEADRMQPRSCP